MTKLFPTYRVLALVVGVLLVVGALSSVCKYFLEEGSTLQQLGDDLTIIWIVHGWIYIGYVVVAFLLSQKARWSIPQLGLMLIAGLIPGLIFWVEHRVVERLRADHPELARA